MLAPITPIIGRLLVEDNTPENKEKTFGLYNHIRFIIALILVVPCFTLMDTCISIWVGSEFIMNSGISFLLCLDLFIHLIHGGCCDYINGAGLFYQEKQIEVVGAIINLVLSVVLCTKLGVVGILIGTVLAQFWFWIGRSYIVYKYCFNLGKKEYYKYIIECLVYIMTTGIATVLSRIAFMYVHVENQIAKFIIVGFTSVGICCIVYAACFSWQSQCKNMIRLLRSKG